MVLLFLNPTVASKKLELQVELCLYLQSDHSVLYYQNTEPAKAVQAERPAGASKQSPPLVYVLAGLLLRVGACIILAV